MKKERILVVDAETSSRETISKMMGQIGYEAVVAGHAREALEWLRREPFTLLVTEIRMPEMDGLELSKVVRGRIPGYSDPLHDR